MIVLPVIARELRAEARNPYNYWLRVLAAGLAIMVFLVIAWSPLYSAREAGGQLFRGMNGLMFFSIWIIAPILTADCLSREKREGTLGLLFLTPLSAMGIVSAKGIIHGFRAAVLVLVVVPVTTSAMFLGGLTWREVLIAGVLNADALMLGLAAGIMASSMSRYWTRAVIFSLILASAFILVFLECCCFFFCWVESGSFLAGLQELSSDVVFTLCTGVNRWGLPTAQLDNLLYQVAALSLVAVAVAALVLRQAVSRVERDWQDESFTKRQIRYHRVFCTPRFWQDMFKKRMRDSLNENPIGWLQHYSWNARIVKWGWCVLVILMEAWHGVKPYDDFIEWQYWPLGLLFLGVSISAANSFIQERRSGAMELILVTPMTVEQIIFGRIKGVWQQFCPSLVAIGFFVLLSAMVGEPGGAGGVFFVVPVAGILLCLPVWVMVVCGLYSSLRRRTFLSAWLMTVAAFMLPLMVSVFCSSLIIPPQVGVSFGIWFGLVMFFWFFSLTAFGALFYKLLRRTLNERTFAVNLS